PRLIVVIACMAVLTASIGIANAGCCGGGGWGPSQSGLTDQQRKDVDSLRLEFLKKTQDIRAEMGKKRLELMELAQKETIDRSAIEKKQDEIWALRDKMRTERRAMRKGIRSLLTPEQLKQRALRKGFGKGFGRGFGRGRGCVGGPGCSFGQGRGVGYDGGNQGYGPGFRRGPGPGKGAS
ncbi:Spy/CpxP family protein refolding chaperone, partial [Thermodesulfobacteriota bacterium]